MRRPTMHKPRLTRGIVAAAVVATFAGLFAPAAAYAAETPPGQGTPLAVPNVEPDPEATKVAVASQFEKEHAVDQLDVGPATDDWLRLSDKNFVFRIYDKVSGDDLPRTKTEAARIYGLTVADASTFIRTGVHEFVQRDKDERILRNNAHRDKVETRQKALAAAHLQMDPATFDTEDRNFVFHVYRLATPGSKLRAGAETAYRGDENAWKTFIKTGIIELAKQDDDDYFERERQKGAEAERRAELELKRKAAAGKIPVDFKPVWLEVTDHVFINELVQLPLMQDPARFELKDATERAARSTDPAVWKAYIYTGIHEAVASDLARRAAAEDEANKTRVREIKYRAENSGLRPRLVAAANAALAGTREDITKFLETGQYEPLTQSLQTFTPGLRGWHVWGAGGDAMITTGDDGSAQGTRQLRNATWKVVNGLADANCYSFESADLAGNYLRANSSLRVQVKGSDGSDQFKREATWCPKRSAVAVQLESKAHEGRILRHVEGWLWAAKQGGGNWFDADHLFYEDTNWRVVDPNPEVSTPLTLDWYNDDRLRALAGSPKSPEVVDGGVRYRDYQNGRAYWSSATRAKFMNGELLAKYQSLGGHKFRLPIDHQAPAGGGGIKVELENYLALYAKPGGRAWFVTGAIRAEWEKRGAESGQLGYPITDEFDTSFGRQSNFENGHWIVWNRDTHAVRVGTGPVIAP